MFFANVEVPEYVGCIKSCFRSLEVLKDYTKDFYA